ncbi:MAG TPA: PspA/IM30 family protein [Kofleriaceae bacterium]|nr:PspA/IM30 family protein [Kofleriaceae bacterium]
MGIFGRMKRAVKSKANAAIDKAIDPAKEIDMAILELEEQQKQAVKDLIAYKASAKAMEKDMAALEEKVKLWEQRAMAAVKRGDDELAKQCLRERKQAQLDHAKVKADRDEAAGYAIELNRSRKRVETQLQVLKLKKGTMATQIAAARSGTGNAFGFSNEVFDRMDRAEEKIDSEAIQAEVDAAMEGEESGSSLEAKLLAAGVEPVGGGSADDELARLKARMDADREKKLLKK